MKESKRASRRYERVVLVLQGGGSLGAYQAGVFEGLTEAGYTPDWVTGVSIGAINALLIAGNPPERRIERLREFWHMVSSGLLVAAPALSDPLYRFFKHASAAMSAAWGVPGFYAPSFQALFAPSGYPEVLGLYDTSALKETLEGLVDFDLLNQRKMRFSVGAVDVHTGNSIYFDNKHTRIDVRHAMASGALPPVFAPVEIDGNHYWDGGIVSNTPLWYVLDDAPHLKGLIVQVDLFSARGELPRDIDQVMERHKDIIYSSKTRFNTTHMKELHSLRSALHRVLQKLPESLRDDHDVRKLEAMSERSHIDIVHLINWRHGYTSSYKDNEFSRTTVERLWAAGLEDVRATLSHPEWLEKTGSDGIRVFDLSHKPVTPENASS